MKVITYNLHKGRGSGRRSILEDAVHALRERDPDLLLCQEVFHGVTDALHQCHFITEAIGHAHAFGPNVHRRRGSHGNATFARMPLARSHNIDATESRLEKRGILRTWLRDGDRPLEVLNVHFSLTRAQRWRQWAKLLSALPDDPRTPVLACGDFNDWSGSLDRWAHRSAILQGALWDTPWRDRRSFPARWPLLPLDRIYYRGVRLVTATVLSGPPWSRLSDHLPVEAVFEPCA